MLLRIVFDGKRYLANSGHELGWKYAFEQEGKIRFIWKEGFRDEDYSYIKAYPMTPEELNKGFQWLLEEGQVEGLAQMKMEGVLTDKTENQESPF